MNIKIEQFRVNLQELINSSNDLPIGIIYYILKYYTKEIENMYYAILNTEYSKQPPKTMKFPSDQINQDKKQ